MRSRLLLIAAALLLLVGCQAQSIEPMMVPTQTAESTPTTEPTETTTAMLVPTPSVTVEMPTPETIFLEVQIFDDLTSEWEVKKENSYLLPVLVIHDECSCLMENVGIHLGRWSEPSDSGLSLLLRVPWDGFLLSDGTGLALFQIPMDFEPGGYSLSFDCYEIVGFCDCGLDFDLSPFHDEVSFELDEVIAEALTIEELQEGEVLLKILPPHTIYVD